MLKLKALFAVFLLMFVGSVSFAERAGEFLATYAVTGTSATLGTSVNAMQAPLSNQRLAVKNVKVNSDLNTAVITIQQGAEAGVTGTYTTVGVYATDATGDYDQQDNNFFWIFDRGYQGRIVVDATATKSVSLEVLKLDNNGY